MLMDDGERRLNSGWGSLRVHIASPRSMSVVFGKQGPPISIHTCPPRELPTMPMPSTMGARSSHHVFERETSQGGLPLASADCAKRCAGSASSAGVPPVQQHVEDVVRRL